MIESAAIGNAKTAAVFGHRRQRRLLMALVADDRSSSDLARLTETPLNLVHYHLRKFIRLGLVVMTRVEARAGAPIKFYRAIARGFFVPADLMTTAPGESLNAQMRKALDRGLSSTITGVSYSCEDGRPRIRVVKAPDQSSVTAELWLELRLNRPDAAALANDLLTVLHAYEARSRDSNRRYIVHAAIAPG